MPPDTPVTIPLVKPTVAIPEDAALHVPPLVISLSDVVKPAHTTVFPDIGAGPFITVTVIVAVQPALSV